MRVRRGAPLLCGGGAHRAPLPEREVRRRVLAALEQAGGRVKPAAGILGVCRRHLYNCLEVLDLWAELERLRQADAERREAERDRAAATLRALAPDGEEPPPVQRAPRNVHRPRPCWWGRRRSA